jgi:hypothetical protein
MEQFGENSGILLVLGLVVPMLAIGMLVRVLAVHRADKKALTEAVRKCRDRYRDTAFLTLPAALLTPQGTKLGVLILYADTLAFERLDGKKFSLTFTQLKDRSFRSPEGNDVVDGSRLLHLETEAETVEIAVLPAHERLITSVFDFASVQGARQAADQPAVAPAPPPGPRLLPPLTPPPGTSA